MRTLRCSDDLAEPPVAHHTRRTRCQLLKFSVAAGSSVLCAPSHIEGVKYFISANPHPSPAFFQSKSTRAFTSGDMAITPGHSRVNPSPGHFRVASTPIFDP